MCTKPQYNKRMRDSIQNLRVVVPFALKVKRRHDSARTGYKRLATSSFKSCIYNDMRE